MATTLLSYFLIDTSVWVHTLVRRNPPTPLQRRVAVLLQTALVATTALVRLELLRGARDEAAYRRIDQILSPLHLLPLDHSLCDDAARLGFALRRQGVTVSAVDLLVASAALRAGATVVHCDRDYDLIARHSPLSVESHVSR
ncbi:MAG: type II toxin-antitoxin system VapC family toxin [Chloroflexota bacterium]